MNLYKKLIDHGDVDAEVIILIKDNDYVMYPMARSKERKWIGLGKLNYLKSGNISELDSEAFIDKVYDCLEAGIYYKERKIDRGLENDIATELFNKAKKDKYQGFKWISIDLDDRKENQIGVYRYRRSSSSEWGASNSEAIFLDANCSSKQLLEAIKEQIRLFNPSVIKR